MSAFQPLDSCWSPETGRRNLSRLRAAIASLGLDGFLLTHGDEHLNEYVAPADERLAWATGFAGSAGQALVLENRAFILVDGRYTRQVVDEVDTSLFEPRSLRDEGMGGLIEHEVPGGARLGYNPRLFSVSAVSGWREQAARRQVRLVPVDADPVDALWGDDRSPPPRPAVELHGLDRAGEHCRDKRARIAAALGADVLLLAYPPSIAWLFNLRAFDVPHTPVPRAMALLFRDGAAKLHIGPDRLPAWEAHLGPDVEVASLDDLQASYAALQGARVQLDPAGTSTWHEAALAAAGAEPVHAPDPVAVPRACKNTVELAGAREAHRRDGVALVRFLAWLDQVLEAGEPVTELGAARALERIRADVPLFRDFSFGTIAAYGPNGALPHYRVTTASDRVLAPGDVLLIDSGAQYLDGTTDCTRTVAVGVPDERRRACYTRVLQGLIALATVRFPSGTSGFQIDAVARRPLWDAGYDFAHGAGHGVGSFMNVHEGPQSISPRPVVAPLRPGMILSNEPGVYLEGEFGIRLENLQAVTDEAPVEGGRDPMLAFEILTLVPFDRRLIATALLAADERAWIDAYHARVLREVGPLIGASERFWLTHMCAPL